MSTHAEHARGEDAGMQRMSPGAMMLEHHRSVRWMHPVLALLGLWLLTTPGTVGYGNTALIVSDLASGVALIALAVAGWMRRAWAPWLQAGVGVWLLFAPLVFTSPAAAPYTNDTLAGALVIGFALLIVHGKEMSGPEIPPGWSYNPSSWAQRASLAALAMFGFLISRYLAAYQLGYVGSAWDPFFGSGTERILTSDVSRAFPVSDAGLGAVAYAFEVMMALMGDTRRWRTMPWMVAFFGIVVIPLGTAQIVLIMLQPVAVGTWCTLCLASAAGMLLMIPLAFDEVVASVQVLVRERREGRSVWRAFWGGVADVGEHRAAPGRADTMRLSSTWWGLSFPWTIVAATAAGLGVMALPGAFGVAGAAADHAHIAGALAVTIAVVALSEPARSVRLVNVAVGVWIVAAAWLVPAGSAAADLVQTLLGIAVAGASIPRGPIRDRYGTAQRAIR